MQIPMASAMNPGPSQSQNQLNAAAASLSASVSASAAASPNSSIASLQPIPRVHFLHPHLNSSSASSSLFLNHLPTAGSRSISSSPDLLESTNSASAGVQFANFDSTQYHSMFPFAFPTAAAASMVYRASINNAMPAAVAHSPPASTADSATAAAAAHYHSQLAAHLATPSFDNSIQSRDNPKIPKPPPYQVGLIGSVPVIIQKKSACSNCYGAKTSCDGFRPCGRCQRLKRGDSCVDRSKREKESADEKKRFSTASSAAAAVSTSTDSSVSNSNSKKRSRDRVEEKKPDKSIKVEGNYYNQDHLKSNNGNSSAAGNSSAVNVGNNPFLSAEYSNNLSNALNNSINLPMNINNSHHTNSHHYHHHLTTPTQHPHQHQQPLKIIPIHPLTPLSGKLSNSPSSNQIPFIHEFPQAPSSSSSTNNNINNPNHSILEKSPNSTSHSNSHSNSDESPSINHSINNNNNNSNNSSQINNSSSNPTNISSAADENENLNNPFEPFRTFLSSVIERNLFSPDERDHNENNIPSTPIESPIQPSMSAFSPTGFGLSNSLRIDDNSRFVPSLHSPPTSIRPPPRSPLDSSSFASALRNNPFNLDILPKNQFDRRSFSRTLLHLLYHPKIRSSIEKAFINNVSKPYGIYLLFSYWGQSMDPEEFQLLFSGSTGESNRKLFQLASNLLQQELNNNNTTNTNNTAVSTTNTNNNNNNINPKDNNSKENNSNITITAPSNTISNNTNSVSDNTNNSTATNNTNNLHHHHHTNHISNDCDCATSPTQEFPLPNLANISNFTVQTVLGTLKCLGVRDGDKSIANIARSASAENNNNINANNSSSAVTANSTIDSASSNNANDSAAAASESAAAASASVDSPPVFLPYKFDFTPSPLEPLADSIFGLDSVVVIERIPLDPNNPIKSTTKPANNNNSSTDSAGSDSSSSIPPSAAQFEPTLVLMKMTVNKSFERLTGYSQSEFRNNWTNVGAAAFYTINRQDCFEEISSWLPRALLGFETDFSSFVTLITKDCKEIPSILSCKYMMNTKKNGWFDSVTFSYLPLPKLSTSGIKFIREYNDMNEMEL